MIEKLRYSSQEFWDFIHLPDNAERDFERINGEIVEVVPSNPYSSQIAGLILTEINIFLRGKNLGHATGEGGGYDITDNDTFAPDVAFISKARQESLPQTGFNPIAPDFAVEVISPSDLKDHKNRIDTKLEKYCAAKIPLLWYVYFHRREVDVYVRGQFIRTVGIDGILDGGDVLPGFTLTVKDIFPD